MIILVTGPLHSGKTTRVGALVDDLKAKGVPVAGYLSRAVLEQGVVAGYDLEVIRTGETIPFLRRPSADAAPAPDRAAGSFRFVPAGLERARAILRGSRPEEILVVDEVGPAEIDGRGIWPALEAAAGDPERMILLVVRESLIEPVRERLPGPSTAVSFDEGGAAMRLLEEMGP
jgi:nucleoside-triphosphatase THEP1